MEQKSTTQRKKKQRKSRNSRRYQKYRHLLTFHAATPVGSYMGYAAPTGDMNGHNQIFAPVRLSSENERSKIILRDKKLSDEDLYSLHDKFTRDIEEIFIEGNRITEFVLINPMDKLILLVLSNNQLVRFPSCDARNLIILDLSNNDFSEAIPPEAFLQFPMLESLDLSSTKLTKLPSSIGELSHLKCLWLDDNQLVELPREIIRLQHIEELSASRNFLEKPWQSAVDKDGFRAVSDTIVFSFVLS